MKYDIAKNEEGPLRRTVKANVASEPTPDPKGKRKHTAMDDNSVSRERHPGLDERLVNVETHLAIRYGQSRFIYAIQSHPESPVKFRHLRNPCSTDSNF